MGKGMLLILMITLLSACGGGTIDLPISTFEQVSGTPGLESAITPTPTATGSPTLTPTFINLPTPTPILYTVVENDNLISIARKFNITLDELLAANPSINTQNLVVGTLLTIPSGKENPSPATSTPMPAAIQQVKCYPNLDGSLYCLALVKNDHSEGLQNISVLMNLLDSKGEILKSQVAFASLDVLRPEDAMPFGFLFPAPVQPGSLPQARLLTAARIGAMETDYPDLDLLSSLVTVDWGGFNARVSGNVKLSHPEIQVSWVWILGIAFDHAGNVVGYHRWESNAVLESTENLAFEFIVASLGPKIDRVDLILEAAR